MKNLNERKAKVIWTYADEESGKEKTKSKSFKAFSEDEQKIIPALEAVVSLCVNQNASYEMQENYEIA